MALDNATHLSDADKEMYSGRSLTAAYEKGPKWRRLAWTLSGRIAMQRTAITNAVMAARTAVNVR